MASINIRPHVDQENAAAAGVRGRLGGKLGNGPVGKTFQSNSQKSLITPRRALGDVNDAHRTHQKRGNQKQNQPPAKKMPAFLLVDKVQNSLSERQSQVTENPDTKAACRTSTTPNTEHDEIEHMYIPPVEKDTFEDILPMSERASTYIDTFKDWRSNLYSFHHADYDNDCHSNSSEEFDPLLEHPIPSSRGYNESDLYVSDSELHEIPLPTLDILGCEDLFLPLL